MEDKEIVKQGYDAYYAGVSPDHSPYMNRYGDNRNALPDWMLDLIGCLDGLWRIENNNEMRI